MKQKPDVIVVGLGLAGLSSAYRLSKFGYKVWAFQQFPRSGSIGTSSAGYSRIIRASSVDEKLMKYAVQDIKEWHQLQKISGQKILYMTGGFNIGPKDHPQILKLKENLHNQSLPKIDFVQYTAQEMMMKYPSLKMPSNYISIEQTKTMGFIDVKMALKCLSQAATKHGA